MVLLKTAKSTWSKRQKVRMTISGTSELAEDAAVSTETKNALLPVHILEKENQNKNASPGAPQRLSRWSVC